MSGVAKGTFGRCGFYRVFGATRCSAEDVRIARAALSLVGGISLASTSDVWCLLVGVFVNDTEQIAGRSHFCVSQSTLQERVVGCAAWFAHSKEKMKK